MENRWKLEYKNPPKKAFTWTKWLKQSKVYLLHVLLSFNLEHYKTTNYWSEPKKSVHKQDPKCRRMSYIDQIELDDKRKKATPGIGVYKLIPTEK